jgi:predicted GIY-YIG superfamily endonuclease
MTHLYKCFDKKDSLLYVGISSNAVRRFFEHKQAKRFAHRVTKITIRTYRTREQAAAAEKRAIKKEHPTENGAQKKPRGNMTPRQVIKHFGSIQAAARSLGITTQAIYNWQKANRVPPRTQAWIQLETGGALKASKGNGR